jgi:hypothetical protein
MEPTLQIQLSPVVELSHWIVFQVQKDNNSKKESFCCTEPEKITCQVYHSKQETQKRKLKFCPDNFVLP